MSRFDAIVIGTGQAGPALARRLAGAVSQVTGYLLRLVPARVCNACVDHHTGDAC